MNPTPATSASRDVIADRSSPVFSRVALTVIALAVCYIGYQVYADSAREAQEREYAEEQDKIAQLKREEIVKAMSLGRVTFGMTRYQVLDTVGEPDLRKTGPEVLVAMRGLDGVEVWRYAKDRGPAIIVFDTNGVVSAVNYHHR